MRSATRRRRGAQPYHGMRAQFFARVQKMFAQVGPFMVQCTKETRLS